jgi:hypothetical protein
MVLDMIFIGVIVRVLLATVQQRRAVLNASSQHREQARGVTFIRSG